VEPADRREPDLGQIGLLLFLSAVGLSSGPAVARSLTEPIGLMLGLPLVVTGPELLAFLASQRGTSPPRTGGLIAGFVGHPSVLAFANSKTPDERINEGYATLFALDQALKGLFVQVIVAIAP
jgi:putative transport protein